MTEIPIHENFIACGTSTYIPLSPEQQAQWDGKMAEMKAQHEKDMKEIEKRQKIQERERAKQEEIYHKHNKTELKDLINRGEWDLYGVYNNTIKIGCQKCGQILYVEILEDPEDGYRSMLGEIKVTKKSDGIFLDKPIDSVYFDEYKYTSLHESPFDGYRVFSAKDKYTWLLFGTEDYDDYYPCFIFAWFPKEQ